MIGNPRQVELIEAFAKDLTGEIRLTGAARMNEDAMRLQKIVKDKLQELTVRHTF